MAAMARLISALISYIEYSKVGDTRPAPSNKTRGLFINVNDYVACGNMSQTYALSDMLPIMN